MTCRACTKLALAHPPSQTEHATSPSVIANITPYDEEDTGCWEDLCDVEGGQDILQAQLPDIVTCGRRSSSLTRVSSQPLSFSLDGNNQQETARGKFGSPKTKFMRPEYEAELRCMRIRIANDYARLLQIDPSGQSSLNILGGIVGSIGGVANDDGIGGTGHCDASDETSWKSVTHNTPRKRRGAVDFGRSKVSALF